MNTYHETERIIYVRCKDVYGNAMVYPDCERAKLFAKIANRIVLNKTILDAIVDLGYQVKVNPGTGLPFSLKQAEEV